MSATTVIVQIFFFVIFSGSSFSVQLSIPLSKSTIQLDKLRIVGGYSVDIKDYKYLVSVQYFKSHICGGSILNEKTIISAAHCFPSSTINNPDFYEIQAGSSYINWGWESFFSNNEISINRAQKIIIHSEYNKPDLFDNDIALIFLKLNLKFSNKIGPISLPEIGDIFAPGTKVEVTGWGTMSQNLYTLSDVLRSVEIEIISTESCNKMNYNEVNEITMLCAGDLRGGKDSCSGDSGGPLITKRNGKNILVGIVSWGYGCGYRFHPGVYTNVSSFLSWINVNSN